MIKTWSSTKEKDVSCEICGSVYTVTYFRSPARECGSFSCEVCGKLMENWNSTTSPSFNLKKRGIPPGNPA